jgi:formate hydrogenlyase subunit 4
MRRSALLWLIAAVAFWGWMCASNVRQATTALILSTIIGVVVVIGLSSFHIIRARLDR